MNIFEIIPANLFNPLSGKNKAIVYDCLVTIYNLCNNEQSFSIDKEIVVEEFKNYFEDHDVFEDEDVEKSTNKDSQTKAYSIIRKLTVSKWIEEDIVRNVNKITIPSYSQSLIECMIGIVTDEETDYKASFYTIYSIISNLKNFEEPYSLILKNVQKHMNELLKSLRKLNTNLKNYIEKIVDKKNPQELIDCLEAFYDEIMSQEFQRIKGDGNISLYKVKILDAIESISEDDVILSLAIVDCKQIEGYETDDQAKEVIGDLIYDINSKFELYQKTMENVDFRYNLFFTRIKERILFLTANDNNMKGKIECILQNLVTIYNINDEDLDIDDDLLSKIVKLFSQSYLDAESLYLQPTRVDMSTISEISDLIVMTKEEEEKILNDELIKMRSVFNQKNINKFISELLKVGGHIKASELIYTNRRDDIRTMYIYLYGNEPNSNYKIDSLDKLVKWGRLEFIDFEIRRTK